MKARLIDGKAIARAERARIADETALLARDHSVVPHLAAVLVGDDPASRVYVRNKERACAAAGMKSTLHRLDASTSRQQLLDLVAALNGDDTVHGILVQLPLPDHLDPTAVLDSVRPDKDVDCFHAENVGLLLQGRPRYLPCTPHGVMKLLEAESVKTAGQHAVIVGRSDIVGKPMAALLMQKGADATVTVCHSRTRNIAEVTATADLLIAAVGRPEFITREFIRPGAVVIDVGINRVDDRLVGDVRFDDALAVASAVTPVPGGVGPMTIAMLLRNTLTAARLSAGVSPS